MDFPFCSSFRCVLGFSAGVRCAAGTLQVFASAVGASARPVARFVARAPYMVNRVELRGGFCVDCD